MRYLKKKCRKEDTLRFGGERENVLKDQREVQATKGRLERKRVAVQRSSETSEQRKSASQLNANGQLSNGTTNPASRGKSASQLDANEQLSNGPTKVPRKEKSA